MPRITSYDLQEFKAKPKRTYNFEVTSEHIPVNVVVSDRGICT